MDILNQWIASQTDGGARLYDATGVVALVPMIAAAVWYLRRHRMPLLKGLAVTVLGYGMTLLIHNLVMWMMEGFASGRYGMEVNLCVGFVYLPLFALLLGAVFDLPYGHTADLLAVSVTAFHVLGRLGCLFTGCCYGYPCSWGLWSIQAESYRFPVVPVEGAFTLAILVFLLLRVGRRGYTPDGRTLPWMLTIYGLCRFGSEFLRDNEKLFLGLSNIALHALFMMAVGVGMLLWTARKAAVAAENEPPLPTGKGRRK